MQDNTKTKVHEAFKTGKASLIAEALRNHFKQRFIAKTYTPKSPVAVANEKDDGLYDFAKQLFSNGDFSESPATPKATESLQIPMAG